MPIARSGSPTAFWDGTTTYNSSTNRGGGVSVGATGPSKAVYLARFGSNVCFYISSGGATTVTMEVAHHGILTPENDEPDQSTVPADASFYPLFYLTTAVAVTFSGAGTQAILVPFFAPAWVRLLNTTNGVTLKAGYEITSE